MYAQSGTGRNAVISLPWNFYTPLGPLSLGRGGQFRERGLLNNDLIACFEISSRVSGKPDESIAPLPKLFHPLLNSTYIPFTASDNMWGVV